MKRINESLAIQDRTRGDWFLAEDDIQKTYKVVSFHYAICYSLLNYLWANDHDFSRGEEALRGLLAMVNASVSKRQHFRKEGFMEVLQMQFAQDDWGYVVVDQATCAYLLICYSDKRAEKVLAKEREQADKGADRAAAFRKAVKNVHDAYRAVFDYLNGHTPDDWDKEFQGKLCEAANGFDHLEECMAANHVS